jgi:uncharacterized protein
VFLVMKISKLCNLRCTYCYEYAELADKARMPLDRLDFFFDSLADHYVAQGWTCDLDFVLHGGEPLLLPETYLRSFVELQRRRLSSRGIPYRNALQTNLTRMNDQVVALLEELEISLGISLDVYGGQRVTQTGVDAQDRVLENLQFLIDTGAAERLQIGAISVLHGANVDDAVSTFRFFNELGMNYRILPIFSITDPPERMRHLMLTEAQVVDALSAVAVEHSAVSSNISVLPLVNYLEAAVRYMTGTAGEIYDPKNGEWALIVNTDGSVYNHAEAYAPGWVMGNIFTEPFSAIMSSPGRTRTLHVRDDRARTCAVCPYDASCSRVPIVEALPSERWLDPAGGLECRIARPMIEFMIERIRRDPVALAAIDARAKLGQGVAIFAG